MDSFIIFAAFFITLIFLINLLFSSNNKIRNLPPSPQSLPIIGHLHLFAKPLHRTLAHLSHLHGPIILLRFGSRPVLIVSSATLAESCFTTNDIAFANRPHLPSVKTLTANFTSVDFASYGPHWRNLRRIAAVDVLSPARVASLATARATEVQALAARLFRDTGVGFQKVDLRSRLFDMMLGVMMGMIAGKGYRADGEAARGFKAVVEEGFELVGMSLQDFSPILQLVAKVQERREAFLQRLIDEQRKGAGGQGEKEKTMIRTLLELQTVDPEYNTDQTIKTLVSTLFFAGTNTSAVMTEWAMSVLLNNPEMLKKARDEIDGCEKEGRSLQEADLPNLPYLHCRSLNKKKKFVVDARKLLLLSPYSQLTLNSFYKLTI